jgi:hypothetical protein
MIEIAPELESAGKQLIEAVDEAALPAQGGMWVETNLGWKYLLVTSDTDGVEKALPEIFRSGKVSQAMVAEDVIVTTPEHPMFKLISKLVKVNRGGKAIFQGTRIAGKWGSTDLDFRLYAVVYRSLLTDDGSDFIRPDTEMLDRMMAGTQ